MCSCKGTGNDVIWFDNSTAYLIPNFKLIFESGRDILAFLEMKTPQTAIAPDIQLIFFKDNTSLKGAILFLIIPLDLLEKNSSWLPSST